MSIVITGATGQLGRLVIEALLRTVAAAEIVALVRDPGKASDLVELGVVVAQGDYKRPQSLADNFRAGDKVLLISSNVIGERVAQHQTVIDAARKAGVSLLAYTSVLHADISPLVLAKDHRQTEADIAASGLNWVILRNGWYTENYTGRIASALSQGKLVGSAGKGQISSAARQDYAEAAAAALTSDVPSGTIFELAGDRAYTLSEFAEAVAAAGHKEVSYANLPEQEYRKLLLEAGLPESIATLIADGDGRAAEGALLDDSGTLSRLIGRPTTPFEQTIAATLQSEG